MGYNEEPNKLSDVQAAVAAGAALGDPRTPDTEPGTGSYVVVPDGYKLESLDEYAARPRRIEHDIELEDTESFIEYVKAYWQEGQSRIFFGQEKGRFVAILDYHKADQPAWCGHVATMTPKRSVEFQAWMGMNRQQMDQVQFARFLEENLPDIVEPAGAKLLEIALTFEAKKDVEFASGVRLQNGQIQFTYNEVVRGTAQKGTIEVPDEFVLGVPIHVNGPNYRIPVRLRWRLKDGKAVFWYEVVRPHRFVEAALREIRERIATDTAHTVLTGTVEP